MRSVRADAGDRLSEVSRLGTNCGDDNSYISTRKAWLCSFGRSPVAEESNAVTQEADISEGEDPQEGEVSAESIHDQVPESCVEGPENNGQRDEGPEEVADLRENFGHHCRHALLNARCLCRGWGDSQRCFFFIYTFNANILGKGKVTLAVVACLLI